MLRKFSPSARLAMYYFLFSAAWVLGSGRVAGWIAGGSAEYLRTLEDFKGLLFVLISSFFIFSISRNIYKKLMNSLHSNKEMLKKYQGVMNATREGIYEYDMKTQTILFSDKIKELLQEKSTVRKDGLVYWQKNIHPDDRERILTDVKNVYTDGAQSWQGEYRFLTPANEYREVVHRMFILRDNGKAYTIIGAIQDVTAQRQLQREFHVQQLKNKTDITRNIIRAEERERNRWAQELHDNIAQMLGVVRLYLGMMKANPHKMEEMTLKTTELVEQSITEIRELSANLKPPVFENGGLKNAIQSLLANIGRARTLKFYLDANEEACTQFLNNDQKLMIYRIVQEQLNNIVKYAHATSVSIKIEIDPPSASVVVRDDGVGFDPDKLVTGIGLKNIRGRLNMFNGHFQINSAPGQGCELYAEFQVTH